MSAEKTAAALDKLASIADAAGGFLPKRASDAVRLAGAGLGLAAEIARAGGDHVDARHITRVLDIRALVRDVSRR